MSHETGVYNAANDGAGIIPWSPTSKRPTKGMQKSREMMVTKLYRLSGLILLISFLLKMARAEKATLDAMAVENPSQVKDSSVADANAQGLTLVHFSAQLERFIWDRGCA